MFRPAISRQIDFQATGRIITEPICAATPGRWPVALYVDMKTYLPEDILPCRIDSACGIHSRSRAARGPPVGRAGARLPTGSTRLAPQEDPAQAQRRASLAGRGHAHRKQGFESPMPRGCARIWPTTPGTSGPGRLGKCGLFATAYVSAKLDEHLAGRHKNNN